MNRQRIETRVARLDGIDQDEWFAVVTIPVLVTFNSFRDPPWRCEACGRHADPCPHAIAAATAAAQHNWK